MSNSGINGRNFVDALKTDAHFIVPIIILGGREVSEEDLNAEYILPHVATVVNLALAHSDSYHCMMAQPIFDRMVQVEYPMS